MCDNEWDSNDATVVCKQLGYAGYNAFAAINNYGPVSGPIWFDDLVCTSSDTSLFNCSYSTATSDCTHDNDVALRSCYCEFHIILWFDLL